MMQLLLLVRIFSYNVYTCVQVDKSLSIGEECRHVAQILRIEKLTSEHEERTGWFSERESDTSRKAVYMVLRERIIHFKKGWMMPKESYK